MSASSRERLLGSVAPRGDLLELAFDIGTPGASGCDGRLGGLELDAPSAEVVPGQLPAHLERLPLNPGVKLGGLCLALQRPQPRARLALDVERAVKVVLRAGELQLRAAPALAVLAEPSGLLDQQPAITRLGGDDRLDPPLRDDRMHLLPQAGV